MRLHAPTVGLLPPGRLAIVVDAANGRFTPDGPRVDRQLGEWEGRQLGYETATGRRRVRQLGTFAEPNRKCAWA